MLREHGHTALRVDLRAYQTKIRLQQTVFDSSVYQSCIHGSHQLHLFIDSLDEGLLRFGTLAAHRTDEFRKSPVDRLFVRIACRTAEWRESSETNLRELWGQMRCGYTH